MNFVFDIGNVLIDFKPEIFLKGLFENPMVRDIINKTIFKSEEWLELDRGTISAKEAEARFCQRQPEYRNQIQETMDRIPEMLTPIVDTAALLPQIKAAGHGLYFLSNYHQDLSRYVQKQYDFFKHFDGGVFSCHVHLIKPDVKIYQHFLNQYGLAPETCLFIDDTSDNVSAAFKSGMQGVLYTGAEDLLRLF